MQATNEPEGVRQAVMAVPKVVIRQLVLLVPLLANLALLAGWAGVGLTDTFVMAGLGVVAVATLLALVGGRAAPLWLLTATLMLDLVGIGLMRLTPDGNGFGPLAVLPAMWLAADHRLRGVGLAFLGTATFVVAPTLVYYGPEPAWWSRGLVLSILAVLCAFIVAGTGQVWVRQNSELEEQGTRLARALDDVLANRALNDAIVGTVDVGLVALDRDGTYQSINPRQAAFMALAFPAGHAGRAGQLGDVFAADRVTRLTTEEMPTSRALLGEEFDDHRIWIGAEPSKQLALSVSARSVRDGSGERDGAVLVYKDITPLMAALKVKDDFVASVSHELRTPLTSIMGFLDLVLDDEEGVDPGVRRKLEVAKRNSERLLDLVSDLLLTAQVDDGYVALDVEPTDLSTIVRESLAHNAPRAEAQGLGLRHSVQPGLVVHGDPVRLRQIVDNLLTNAVKYTPSGGSVAVELEGGDEDLWLKVSDTGIGIAPEDLGRLFMRFFRSQEAEDRAIQGIGLGLAITRSIVEAHGGTILVESEPDRGSTFIVRLPLDGPRSPGTSGGHHWAADAG
ncbi:sensor histidine kinase [Nocardioides caldifontis]|uniref:sensor histidine kinase n=1 Tax=Nocardioides caldifontis TaxID=2588938 RepID=UPI0011E03B64|nr:HAMP domain-containing sensor histidine kinase [Nocardioides caldifontis]